MLTDVDKRVVSAVLSRFGVKHDQVEEAVKFVLQTRAQGGAVSLIDHLIAHKLLSQAQGQELRVSLDATQIDSRRNGSGEPPAVNSDELRTLGEYRILRRLGEGGMGSVYLGYNQEQDRRVAIKVLPNRQAANQTSVARFYREAESGALLNHPNIVARISDGQDRATGKHYLVMEYVDGPSAQELLERFGRLDVGDAVHIVLDVAKALEHAHSRNIVHRDIKPGNILLTQSGVAKLADLGLAKRTDGTSHLTAARQGFGTPYYMPYEQAMNAKSADARSDIYALGATLYHLLTGEVPFPGNNHLEIVDKKNVGIFAPARSMNDKVPMALDDIIEKTLARDQRDRYQTASELIVDLERSELAAPVPSFIDFDRAMLDPLVRRRVTTPTQPTAPDMQLAEASPQGPAPPPLWFVQYRDRYGQLCKAKGTAGQIRRRLREGRLMAEAQASRQAEGKYLPLNAFPEFQDAVAFQTEKLGKQKTNAPTFLQRASPARAKGTRPGRFRSGRFRLLSIASGLVALLAVALLVFLLAR